AHSNVKTVVNRRSMILFSPFRILENLEEVESLIPLRKPAKRCRVSRSYSHNRSSRTPCPRPPLDRGHRENRLWPVLDLPWRTRAECHSPTARGRPGLNRPGDDRQENRRKLRPEWQ